MASLIEGLPDAIAMQCLARAPLGMHRAMRAVCRSWRAALRNGGGGGGGAELFRVRSAAGLREEWLFVTSFEPDRVWEAYDPSGGLWHTLPLFPSSIARLSNFGTAALHRQLFVVGGGSDEVDHATGERDRPFASAAVWCFDALQGRWEARSPMLTPRSQFACAAVAGKIVVAGGFGCSRRPLASAEIYDPEADRWEAIADVGEVHNAACSGLVLGGAMALLYKGHSLVQLYDPALDSWTLHGSQWREFPGRLAVVGDEVCGVASSYLIRGLNEPQLWRHWAEYFHRIGFGVAGIGNDLYVVGGILGPQQESMRIHVLKEVDIWSVEGGEFEKKGTTSMTWCSGTVLGCAVVSL
ncbi:hypothetical protein SELMODRAFT_88328 [Selaginella moellendorffii]|uniref:F-box domain-containing protein n=1 Tax=Selaginella moellendorffii TaxID=88036 RepID=D8R986_SELML|nr:F-box/kelch-repeat protein SKIP30 [Selaginella moellendorffii]EFJ31108.1 hypothetical protein SELMODRAFT_88328 [Selaginella moellendorffii]|eukprot:XP_002967761.1 F-box/kelch-repeat protein SKIP30 [Selaginella moellendorffii]